MLPVSPPANDERMHLAKHKFYIEVSKNNKKTLVIGCGRKIELGFSSPQLPNLIPCSMNRDHTNDLLIDIDHRAEPDVVMDFGNWEQMRLHNIAPKHFERIEFEYLSIHPQRFTEIQIIIWLRGADRLLANGGQIAFLNAHDGYLKTVRNYFSTLSNYDIILDGTTPATFTNREGRILRNRQGSEQEHKYCLVRKNR